MEERTSGSMNMCARCVHQLRLFFIALQFFTRLPIPRWVGFDAQWLQHASRYFPAVGLLVGLLSAAVYALAAYLWPHAIAVLLAMIASIYLTGAFHEDGFADTCDGFGGGTGRERVLEIMKDSRIGAYGAIGIVLMLALKWLALSSLSFAAVLAALLIAHPLSRLLAVSLIWRMQYAKENGKAKPMAQQMSNREFVIATLTAMLPMAVILIGGWLSWLQVTIGGVLALAGCVWMARLFQRRIDGYTGDCLGAVQQLTEVLFYLGLLAALRY
jgi:adenosylcobinamide-GDP ribazoletransferase